MTSTRLTYTHRRAAAAAVLVTVAAAGFAAVGGAAEANAAPYDWLRNCRVAKATNNDSAIPRFGVTATCSNLTRGTDWANTFTLRVTCRGPALNERDVYSVSTREGNTAAAYCPFTFVPVGQTVVIDPRLI